MRRLQQDLLEKKASVTLIRRPESTSTFAPEGVKVAPVDISDVSALTKVFKDNSIDVVISVVGVKGYDSQLIAAEAAQKAGVKLFVPSEYGIPTSGAPIIPGLPRDEYNAGILGVKGEISEKIQARLPTLRLYVSVIQASTF